MLQKVTRRKAVRELVEALPVPSRSLRLRKLAPDKLDPEGLSKTFEAEPDFALRVVELVRLSSGAAQSVVAIGEAIDLLGPHVIRAIGLGLSAFDTRHSLSEGKRKAANGQTLIALDELLIHSIGCATIAARLAPRF